MCEAEIRDAVCVIKDLVNPCFLRERIEGDWTLVSRSTLFKDINPGLADPSNLEEMLLARALEKGFMVGALEWFIIW